MSELHELSVTSQDPKILEAVDAAFVKEGLLRARDKTIAVMHEIRTALTEGLTEDDARRLALRIFADHGVEKHWHKPYIRFGAGTALTFNQALQETYRLQAGDPFYLDLGPIWRDHELGLKYEGDYGDTFILGENPEANACITAAHQLFFEAEHAWKTHGLSGQELYKLLTQEANKRGYVLKQEVNGHRLSDFPHHQYSRERLCNVEFHPQGLVWILEVQIADPVHRFGAFFEDVLGIERIS